MELPKGQGGHLDDIAPVTEHGRDVFGEHVGIAARDANVEIGFVAIIAQDVVERDFATSQIRVRNREAKTDFIDEKVFLAQDSGGSILDFLPEFDRIAVFGVLLLVQRKRDDG